MLHVLVLMFKKMILIIIQIRQIFMKSLKRSPDNVNISVVFYLFLLLLFLLFGQIYLSQSQITTANSTSFKSSICSSSALGNNENAGKKWREKQRLIQGRKQDSYNNQSWTGVHRNSLTGVHGNTNRIFENRWKSQKIVGNHRHERLFVNRLFALPDNTGLST